MTTVRRTAAAAATFLTVTAGQTRTGIDVVLRKGTLVLRGAASANGKAKVGRTLTA